MFELFHQDIRETLSLYCGRSILKRIARLYYYLRIYPPSIYLIPRGIIRDKMRFILIHKDAEYEYKIIYRNIIIIKNVTHLLYYVDEYNEITSIFINTFYLYDKYRINKSLCYDSDGTYRYSMDIVSHNLKIDIG